MRAFLIGVVAAIVISVVAALALDALDMSSADVYQAPASVRL